MALVLTDSQEVELTLRPKTAAGNVGKVDGTPAWTSSAPDVIAVAPAADGLSAKATTTGKLGTAQVQCVADADMGDGVKEITAVLTVEVNPGAAVSLGLDAGEPTEKPEVAPA
jgi:hypothetical protein